MSYRQFFNSLLVVTILMIMVRPLFAQHLIVESDVVDGVIQENQDIVGISMPAVHHEYVDLGLPSGLLWSTCNVGANSPEEYGDYFAWGETSPKKEYSESTYKWIQPDILIKKELSSILLKMVGRWTPGMIVMEYS